MRLDHIILNGLEFKLIDKILQLYLVVTALPSGNSVREPPDPISNSEVKLLSADDSVGFPHAKVGHC